MKEGVSKNNAMGPKGDKMPIKKTIDKLFLVGGNTISIKLTIKFSEESPKDISYLKKLAKKYRSRDFVTRHDTVALETVMSVSFYLPLSKLGELMIELDDQDFC